MSTVLIEDGRELEESFFGKRRFRRRGIPFLTYEAAIAQAKAVQRILDWDPANPPVARSREFFLNVKGFLDWRNSAFLRFYMAIGTRLDYDWQTDCFFELRDRARVTIDLTARKWKPFNRFLSPDIVLTEEDFACEGVSELGRKIAHLLERRLGHIQ